MSDPFRRFGIEHLSASSLNTWRSSPALWCLRYLWRVRDDYSPAAWRGSAVEAGLEAFLRHGPTKDGARQRALQVAQQSYEANAQGDLTDDVQRERSAIPLYMDRAFEAMTGENRSVTATQLRIELWLDRIPIPAIGYVDFILEDGSLFDLKTTERIPSKPKPEHARQVAVYMSARERDDGHLLYVGPAKHLRHPVEDRDAQVRNLTRDAQSLMWFLQRCEDKADAIRSLPADTDHFTWSDVTRARLLEILDGEH